MAGLRWTELDGRGYYSRDGSLEAWLAVIVDHLDGSAAGTSQPWLRRLREDWRQQLAVRFDGLASFCLDGYLTDPSRRAILSQICRALQQRVQSEDRAGHELSGSAVDLSDADVRAKVVRGAEAMIWLLEEPH